MHTYCIQALLELVSELKEENGFIEVNPGVIQLAPILNDRGVPAENIRTSCFCENCVWGGRYKEK